MGIFSALLGALSAIPKILDSLEQLMAFLNKVDIEKFNAMVAKTMQDTAKASTEDEFKAAAKEINEATHNL